MGLYVTRKHLYFFIFFCLLFLQVRSQNLIDPCFQSIREPGQYVGSDYLKNFSFTSIPEISTDLLEWDGAHWQGVIPESEVDLPPPEGCSLRAIWMGNEKWTTGGEAFGLKLDKPLLLGKKYTFTFTYASEGKGSDTAFEPLVYTVKGDFPTMPEARMIGRMPAAGSDWETKSITIQITEIHANHTWIILLAKESSGIVLSNCEITEDLKLSDSTTLCNGKALIIQCPVGYNYRYLWNTSDTTSALTVEKSGEYHVTMSNFSCQREEKVDVKFSDCELRLEMPNVFTPNGDTKNQTFVPIDHNFISSGTITMYNRWGEEIFTGDLFTGWEGQTKTGEASAGVYYYEINYVDLERVNRNMRGVVSLIR